jgi:hypothetical protein
VADNPHIHLADRGLAETANLTFLQGAQQLRCTRGPSGDLVEKSVPPVGLSNRPCRSAVAPVYAPFTWPKSSASTISSTSAAQLTAQNFRSRRLLRE